MCVTMETPAWDERLTLCVTQVLSKLTEQQINQLKNLTRLPVEQLDKLPISDSQKARYLYTLSDSGACCTCLRYPFPW